MTAVSLAKTMNAADTLAHLTAWARRHSTVIVARLCQFDGAGL